MLPQRSRGLPPDSESELPDDAAEAAAAPRAAPARPAAAPDQARRNRLSVHPHARARTARQQGIKLRALLSAGQARADQAAHLSHRSLPSGGAVPLIHGLQGCKRC